ncbi:hypothetical protein ABZU76_46170 [Amycolatopsis sp. NPDC005232]|uniref:hypothetical protein n=1 Tax=Amycolatopsis sp. NPDC005232 TaxID=3157027 RepID=UPI0033A856B5
MADDLQRRPPSGASAGAALTALGAQQPRDEERPQPDWLVPISPWLDVALREACLRRAIPVHRRANG